MNVQNEMQETLGLFNIHDQECLNVWGRVCRILRSITNNDYCYPDKADGIIINSGEGAWIPGSYTEIIPQNVITSNFRMHKVYIEATSDGGCWQLDFYKGTLGNETWIASIRQSGISEIKGDAEIRTSCLDANERVTCKASHSAGSENIVIAMGYHLV